MNQVPCPCGCGSMVSLGVAQLLAPNASPRAVTAAVKSALIAPKTPVNDFSGRDFAAGVVTGVRSFKVDQYARLTGIHYTQVWTPGENLAVCRAPERDETDTTFQAALAVWYEECRKWEQKYRGASPGIEYAYSDGDFEFRRIGSSKISSTPVARNIPDPPARPEAPLRGPHPLSECQCGFYGYYDGSDDYRSSDTVTAVVEGYGEVLIGSRGFRATKARIRALCIRTHDDPDRRTQHVPEVVLERIGRLYAEIPLFTRFEDLVAAFPPDLALEHSPDNDPDFWTRS